VICNAAILVLGLVLLSFTPWWIWPIPALLWGIGLAIHGFVAMTASEDDWDEQNESMQWWLEERRRRHEERMAVAGRPPAGQPMRGRKSRARFAADRAAERERLRVAVDDSGEPEGLRIAVRTDDEGSEAAEAEHDATASEHRSAQHKRL